MQVAGRTIIYSAATVAVALATLCTFPQAFLYSMGIGGAVTAIAAVVVSLVALPALLALLGPRVNSGAPARWKRAAERTARQEKSGPWYRLAQLVMRRPGLFAAVSATLLIVVALPVLGLKFTGVDLSSTPDDLSARTVDDALRRDFDLNLAETTVLVRAPRSERPRVERYAEGLRKLPGASDAGAQPPRSLRGGLWTLTLTPAGGTLDDPSRDLVERIRAGPSPFPVAVTGQTAQFIDQRESIGSHLVLALVLLCGMTVLVLFLMTGSVVLPLKSLLMNALSLGAAFGLLVLIFQKGNLEGLLGFESQGALELTQPVLLFALAFGLSTDYAVILLSRIKEARTRGASDNEAVAIGLERTGRIVTQAAILFCIAIGAFATSSVIFIKQVGVGTALAVLIDASIVRALLVPSLMALLGSRNWWAPGWLRRVHQRIGLSEA
jgi:RND superfamily putative drug exporter